MDELVRRVQEQMGRYADVASLPPAKLNELLASGERLQTKLQALPPDAAQALLSQPEEQDLSQRYEIARKLWSPANRSLALLLHDLPPGQWEALKSEGWLALSTDPQPGEAALSEEASRAFRESQPGMPGPGSQLPVDPAVAASQRQYQAETQEQWASASGYRVTVRLETARLHYGGALWLYALASPIHGGRANPYAYMNAAGAKLVYFAGPLDPQEYAEREREDSQQRRAELEQDAVLGTKKPLKFEFKPRARRIGPGSVPWRFRDLLPTLSRVYGVSFLSDAYTSSSPPIGDAAANAGPVALFDVLDKLAGPNHRWDRQGRLIRIRSRDWFFDRPRQIPDRLVQRWADACAARGALTLSEYVTIASSLSDSQLDGFGDALDEAGLQFTSLALAPVYGGRYVLRLYGSLTPAQLAPLWGAGTLPQQKMDPPQRELFLAGLRELNRTRGLPMPLNMEAWQGASLALSSRNSVLTVAESDGGPLFQLHESSALPGAAGGPPAGGHASNVPADPVAPGQWPGKAGSAAQSSPGLRLGQDTAAEAAAVAPSGAGYSARHRILELEFELNCGAETSLSIKLPVAAP